VARLRCGPRDLDRTSPGLAEWCDPDALVDQIVEIYRELV
jgi:hypothetical protein